MTLPQNDGLLIVPRLRVQNANAISSPLTHGFPAMTAFLGLMWALERVLAEHALPLLFESVGVVCHHAEEQTTHGGYLKTFHLTRNPVGRTGDTAAIVEEGRIHLEITLIFGVTGGFVEYDQDGRQRIAEIVADAITRLRVAGGSVLPPTPGGMRRKPQLVRLSDDPGERMKSFRTLRRHWLPGFVLVCRDDLLSARQATVQLDNPEATRLDAWLDLSRFNWRPVSPPKSENTQVDSVTDASTLSSGKTVQWAHDRSEGWIVPIPVGYGALSEVHPAGQVRHARDQTTDFRFVESLYSLGQWISPHRLTSAADLLWYVQSDIDRGLYRCCNDFAPAAPPFTD